jgi:hypothetical protein
MVTNTYISIQYQYYLSQSYLRVNVREYLVFGLYVDNSQHQKRIIKVLLNTTRELLDQLSICFVAKREPT